LAIIDIEGELHLDATLNQNAWDEYDDVALLNGLRALSLPTREQMEERWHGWIEYARPVLEKTGVVTYNEDGHHYVATRRLNMLQIDAIRQLSDRVRYLEEELAAVYQKIDALVPPKVS
jgi:hypothetical protein